MLPKTNHILFSVVVPSNKQTIKMRAMLVKDEKIILVAKASGDENDILAAVKQVVNNCVVVPEKFDIDRLPLYDLEWLFVRLRAMSVSSISKVAYQDKEDEEVYPFEVDLDKVEMKWPEDAPSNMIDMPGGQLEMQHAPAAIWSDKAIMNLEGEEFFDAIVRHSIVAYHAGDAKTTMASVAKSELDEFIGNLDLKTYNKMREYVDKTPRLYYQLKYKNKLGNERTITLETLNDFFTLA